MHSADFIEILSFLFIPFQLRGECREWNLLQTRSESGLEEECKGHKGGHQHQQHCTGTSI